MKKLLIAISLLVLTQLNAATLEKITMPDSMKIAGKTLVLNGLGLRQATIFKVDVYVGGLYVTTKSKDQKVILDQLGPKFINMHFVRDVSKSKLNGGWEDAFDNAVKNQTKLKTRMERFYKMMEDIKENQEIKITFFDDKVNVVFNGKNKGDILGADFSKALLAVWFINASDEGLRDGLLGK